jgi:hypothetical protein
MLQVLFGAGTVFLLLALQATAGPCIAHAALQAALEHAERCVRYLHEMGRSWHCAARTGDILQALLHERLGPIITRRMAHKGVPLEIAAATASLDGVSVVDALDGSWSGELPPYTPHWRECDESLDFFGPTHNTPGGFGDFASEENMFTGLDMAAFSLPTLDSSGVTELWESALFGNE